MTPMPSLPELITTVEADADSTEPLSRLAVAATAGTELSSTTDVLIGHFVEQARSAGHTWVEISGVLGVSKQAVHKRFASAAPDLSALTGELDRFTKRTLGVLRAAEDIASASQTAPIDSGQILLAMYAEPASIATTILTTRGITRDQVAEAYGAATSHGSVDTPTTFTLPHKGRDGGPKPTFGTDAVALLAGSLQAALSLGHNYIGTEHLLLAAHQSPTIAGRLLDKVGLHREDVDTAVEAALVRHVAARSGT